MDDAITRIEARFDRVDRSLDQLREDLRDLRGGFATDLRDLRGGFTTDLRELHGGFTTELRELRAEIATSGRQLTTIGWALVGILLVQLIAAVAALH
jgi:hypothetical protein